MIILITWTGVIIAPSLPGIFWVQIEPQNVDIETSDKEE
jgi:hypothetical protein